MAVITPTDLSKNGDIISFGTVLDQNNEIDVTPFNGTMFEILVYNRDSSSFSFTIPTQQTSDLIGTDFSDITFSLAQYETYSLPLRAHASRPIIDDSGLIHLDCGSVLDLGETTHSDSVSISGSATSSSTSVTRDENQDISGYDSEVEVGYYATFDAQVGDKAIFTLEVEYLDASSSVLDTTTKSEEKISSNISETYTGKLTVDERAPSNTEQVKMTITAELVDTGSNGVDASSEAKIGDTFDSDPLVSHIFNKKLTAAVFKR